MTYEEYKHEIATKGYINVVSGRIKSKKPESTIEFHDLATETAEFTKNQQKAIKKANKAMNDAEIARRQSIYAKPGRYNDPTSYPKPEALKTDPNSAFRRKKTRERVSTTGRVVTTKELDDLVDTLQAKHDKTISDISKKAVGTKHWDSRREEWVDVD
jgi:hypothetical protein